MRKSIPIVYCVIFIVGFVLTMIAQFVAKPERVLSAEQTQWQRLEIASVKQISEDIREMSLHWKQQEVSNSCMAFFSSHCNIYVYADEALVYANEKSDSVFGRTTGARWNFVEIPQKTEEILVRVEAIYPELRGEKIEFLQGNARQMYMKILQKSMIEVVVSSINIMIGIALIGYWLLARRRMTLRKDVLFAGMVALIVGIWTLNETDAAIILLPNRVAASFLTYVMIMFMSTPFILFECNFMEVKNKRIPDILCIANFINIVICMTLHFTGILELRRTLFLTHILMVVALAYTVWVVGCRIREYGWDKKVKINMVGAILLIVSFAADMVGYYLGLRQTDIIGKFGLLILILLIGYQTVSDLFAKIDEGRKAEIYRELAVKDMLTGLYNRNAYDNWQAQREHWHDIMLVTFDLNNLKRCNDTMGHADGDTYIKTAASMISEVFGNEGRCYRIGGDEFCAVLKDAHRVNIEKKIEQLQLLEQEYNRKNQDLKIQIAYGYAAFDENIDQNMEDTRSRADVWMYENKRKIKEKGLSH